jgi:hypothetical protein
MTKKVRQVLWYPTQAKTGLEWGTQHPAGREGELQIPRLRSPRRAGAGGMTKGRAVTLVRSRQIGWTERNSRSLRYASPNFLSRLVALANFTRPLVSAA